MKTIGIIVNPVAGLGGPLALKGSDHMSVSTAESSQHATGRATRALAFLNPVAARIKLIACAGSMGAESVGCAGLTCDVLSLGVEQPTTRQMTQAAALALVERGADLIVFAGGDGTARDIVDVVSQTIPVLGIPSGVKMHSGVFAATPEAAGRLLRDVVDERQSVRLRSSEVMDMDETQLASGRIAARLFGYAMTPDVRHLLQNAKARGGLDEDLALTGAALDIIQGMHPGVTYLVGPGTSSKFVLAQLGLEGTLLGVDALRDGALIGTDLDANRVRELSARAPMRIILGVTGGQGFVLGRGNQQIPADVIRKAGWANIIVIAGAAKLAQLEGGRLYIDTGDPATDAALAGFIRVHTGPGRFAMLRVSS